MGVMIPPGGIRDKVPPSVSQFRPVRYTRRGWIPATTCARSPTDWPAPSATSPSPSTGSASLRGGMTSASSRSTARDAAAPASSSWPLLLHPRRHRPGRHPPERKGSRAPTSSPCATSLRTGRAIFGASSARRACRPALDRRGEGKGAADRDPGVGEGRRLGRGPFSRPRTWHRRQPATARREWPPVADLRPRQRGRDGPNPRFLRRSLGL